MLGRRVNGAVLELIEDKNIIFSITEKATENEIEFAVAGALRNDLVYEFDDELSAAVSVGKSIVLDMRDLSYIASASLKVLLRIQQKLDSTHNGLEMKLVNVPENIMKIFAESGLSDILDIEENK